MDDDVQPLDETDVFSTNLARAKRLELIALLSEDGRFDFDLAETAWGGLERRAKRTEG